MKKIDNKGIAHLGLILGVVIVILIIVIGWFVWDKNQKEDKDTTQESTAVQETSEVEEGTVDSEKDLYSISLDGSVDPKKVEVEYKDFLVTDAGGGALAYNESDENFITGEVDGTGGLSESSIEVAEPITSSQDGTAVFVLKRADADTYRDTYAIDLKNGSILTIEFNYSNYDDGINRSPNYMTLDEIEAQRKKDLEAVKTFEFN